MISLHNQSNSNIDQLIEKVETLSTTLRAKTINFLTVNCQKWQQDWIPDPAATSATEGGQPASDLKTFIQEVLPRPARWVCGLCLAGVSLMQGCTVVVWQYKGGPNDTHKQDCWKWAAVIRGRKESSKPAIIPVALHYWPKEWAMTQSEEKETTVSQEMSNMQALAPLCRGGVIEAPPSTPLRAGRKDCSVEELLKTSFGSVETLL